MPVVEGTEIAKLKIECRRSLHSHAVDACKRGWSAAEWEDWAVLLGKALVDVIGHRELECIVRVVWKIR